MMPSIYMRASIILLKRAQDEPDPIRKLVLLARSSALNMHVGAQYRKRSIRWSRTYRSLYDDAIPLKERYARLTTLREEIDRYQLDASSFPIYSGVAHV